jgi:hypothetical protein
MPRIHFDAMQNSSVRAERNMKDIPPIEKNPNGLHQRYTITKNNGEPVDFSAVYFVLRLDSGGRDWAHIGACRAAARAYVDQIRKEEDASHMQQTADELEALLDRLEQETFRQ